MKINKESGQASRLLLVLAIVVFIAGIIVFLVMKMATPAPKPQAQVNNTPVASVTGPFYTKQLNNINFIFESATDKGNILSTSEIISNTNGQQMQNIDADPGGKFLEVTVGAQNEGKLNTSQGAWDMGNVVDSEGRNFIPLDQNVVGPWLPSQMCGALLKPAFDPVPCVKLYEVSNESTGLKITVKNMENAKKPITFLLDLKVQ
jgi:hypothetical protein